MHEGYVSQFPGTSEVDPAQVFATSGYHEPQQNTSGLVVAIFVAALLSLIPIFGSWISLLSLPAAFGVLQERRIRDQQLPGEMLLRAALGVSVLGLGIGIACILPFLMATGIVSS